MSPPLRKPADVAALREALIGGEIDTIATDHCSFNLHGQKDRGRGDFRKIPNGGAGIEHRPALIATSFAEQVGPEGLCRLMSENPAKVFGMWPRKGRLAEGADADVCVWDPEARWTIHAATQHQAVDHTPYEGFACRGRAHLVYVGGELVAQDGEPTGARPGAFVSVILGGGMPPSFTISCFFKRKGETNMSIKAIVTDKAPAAVGPYSAATQAGSCIHVSGQLPIDPATGEFAGDDIKAQTRQSLTNIKNILEAAGASMANVAEVTVLLDSIADFGPMNEVYGEFFSEPYPARAAFEVAALPKAAKVEIKAVAYL